MSEISKIRVGGIEVGVHRARGWIEAYTSADVDPKKPYAFPAYDSYDTGTDATHLNHGDLLAPELLNVQIKLPAFYGLDALRPDLELALRNPHLDVALAEASDEAIASAVAPIYTLLDGPQRPIGVGVTKLSKLVHRKQPAFLVLHDVWVEACYLGADAPMQIDPHRSWAGYMIALHQNIRDDIKAAGGFWDDVRGEIPTAGGLTDVRLLDIIAWTSQGKSRS